MKHRFITASLLAASTLAVLFVIGAVRLAAARPAAPSATLTVTTSVDLIADDGLCSLREAVVAANTDTAFHDCPAGSGADTIVFDAALPQPLTIVLTTTGANEDAALTGDLDLIGRVTISGTGRSTLAIDGHNADRVFEVRPASTVTITGVTIQHGSSGPLLDGGGAKVLGTLNLHHSLITHNAGGGLYTDGGALLLSYADVISNTGAPGIRLINPGATLVFADGAIGDNAVGGVTSYQGSVTLTRCTVENNRGGGLYNASAQGIGVNTPMVVGSCVVRNNSTTGSGGGAHNTGPGARLSINNSSFLSNTAGVGGGAVYNENILIIQGSTFAYNHAGGGAAIRHIFGTLDLKNSTVSDNVAEDNAGGLYASDSATLLNVTIAGNTVDGDGGGVTVDTAFITIKNSIVADNQSGTAADGNCFLANGGSITSLGYNLDGGDSCNFHATGDLTTTAPVLGALADNGGPTWTRALLFGSPAIDHGTNAGCPATDQRGVPRPQGGVCDMGAYEFGDAANLSIAKSGPASALPGSLLTYTLLAANLGPLTAESVTLTDQLPAGVAFGGVSAIDWICGETGGAITCTRSAFTLTTSSIVITATAPDSVGPITNTASITSATPDASPGNNTAVATTWITVPLANLAISKRAEPTVALIDAPITYTLRITNTGPQSAALVTVTDQLPAGVVFGGASGVGWLCSEDVGVLTCTRSALGVSTSSIVITATAPTTPGVITNTVSITSATLDPNLANNTAGAAIDVIPPTADLALSKHGDPAAVFTGAPITYTLRITNTGPQSAALVTVTDQLPAGVVFGGASGAGWLCGEDVGVLTCTRSALGVSTSSIVITATAPTTPGVITNTASIASATFDPDTGDNIAGVAVVVVEPLADLSLSKHVEPSPVMIDSPLTYTLRITNAGPQAAHFVTLTDQLPPDVIFGGVDAVDWACNAAGGVVNCTRPTLDVTTSSVVITVTSPASIGVITNTATITSATRDPADANNAAQSVSAVYDANSADFAVNVQAQPSPVMIGQVLTYTLIVTNAGPAAADVVTVTNALPPEVTYGGVAAVGWTCGETSGVVGCSRLDFGPGSDTIVITATAPVTIVTLIDRAEVIASVSDYDPRNNVDVLMTPVVRPWLWLPVTRRD